MVRLSISLFLLLCIHTRASAWKEDTSMATIFRNSGVSGTFVLHDVSANSFTGYDSVRAQKRFCPASTFKFPNSLIGLASGAVLTVDEPIPYKGPEEPFIPEWKRDMGLREAFPLSNVPIYQELARRVGLKRMRVQVRQLEYGNEEIGTTVDNFWLSGPLRISALEQVRFLSKLAQNRLPYPPELQKSVREIALVEHGEGWKLYAKTGWHNAPGPGVGWWVGWVEQNGHLYTFALNMDMHNPTDGPRRIELGKACLRALGCLTNR